MIALGLVGLVVAYLLLRSGFDNTDPRDEIVAALNGGKAPRKQSAQAATDPTGGNGNSGTVTVAAPSQRKQALSRLGYKVISTVADHQSRPLGDWESDNAIDVVPDPNLGKGTPVHAVENGTIGLAFGYQVNGGYRLHLMTGLNEFYYAHFIGYAAGILPGRRVKAGTVIGYMGNTGNARGGPYHVHFAARQGDPNSWAGAIF